jgi:hypothetical protein
VSLGTIMDPLAFLQLLQSKNTKIKIYRTIISLLFCKGVKVGLTLREEHRLRVFENRGTEEDS